MPFPSTPLLDNFNRATLDVVNWSSGTFFGDSTPISIIGSTQLGTTSASGSLASGNYWLGGPYSSPVQSYIDVATLAGAGLSFWQAIWQGSAATPSGYELQYDHATAATNVFLTRLPSSTLASVQVVGGLLAGDSLGYEVNETTKHIQVFRQTGGSWNQTPIIDFTDTSMLTGPWNLGMEVIGTAWRLDNLGGGSSGGPTIDRWQGRRPLPMLRGPDTDTIMGMQQGWRR